MSQLSLARTKAALEAHDKIRKDWDEALDRGRSDEIDPLYDALDKAEKAVGEAFAQDTAHINQYDTARRQLPCTWLRGLVAKYG